MYFLDALLLLIFATAFSFLCQASQVADKCLVSRFCRSPIHVFERRRKKGFLSKLTSKRTKQQGCQSKALLSPENIDCPVDEISPCSCAWTPLMIINLCCLVNSCLLSPDGTGYLSPLQKKPRRTLTCMKSRCYHSVDCGLRAVSLCIRAKPLWFTFTIFLGGLLTACRIDVQVPGFSIEIPCPATEKGLSSTWYFIQSREVKYVSVDSTTSTVTKYIEPSPTISQVITPRSSIAVSIGGSTTFSMSRSLMSSFLDYNLMKFPSSRQQALYKHLYPPFSFSHNSNTSNSPPKHLQQPRNDRRRRRRRKPRQRRQETRLNTRIKYSCCPNIIPCRLILLDPATRTEANWCRILRTGRSNKFGNKQGRAFGHTRRRRRRGFGVWY